MGTDDEVKHYKVRIEFSQGVNFRAIEAWLEAPDIITAGECVMTYFGALGIEPRHVTRLIELDYD